ncbi:MAG TPA: hypothetical protein VK468_09270, partial [Pyrinomonadaceae bacterium]|nr:hypothetical protein [Pyrinomonadaceae bacterium]
MRRLTNIFSAYAAIALLLLGLGAAVEAQQRNDRQVRDIVRSLNSRVDDFQYSLRNELQNGSVNTQDAADLRRNVRSLQDKVSAFDENLTQRRDNRDDVTEIISAAKDVDGFFRQGNKTSRNMESDWTGVRGLIDRLATNYNIAPDWTGSGSVYPDTRGSSSSGSSGSSGSYPPSTGGTRSGALSTGLTGTYQLDSARTESTADMIA